MLAAISTLVLIIIGIGLRYYRRPEIHIPCMSVAFAMDLGLLLYIEWSAHAIDAFAQEITRPVHGGLLFFHVAVSLLMVLLYIGLTVTGTMLFKGKPSHRKLHRRMAEVFVICRLANYITSFWIT